MMINDPLSDMIARIKNAATRKRSSVLTPASKLRQRVLDVLAVEGYIRGYKIVENPGEFPQFEIELKYFDGNPVIAEISRVSKPGRRVYSSISDLKPIKNGLGISILPLSAVDSHHYSPGVLAVRPLTPPVPFRTVAIAWRASFPRPKAIEILADSIRLCSVAKPPAAT